MNSKKNYITAMLALTAMATTAPAQQQRTVGVMDGKVSISGLKAAKSGSDFSLKMGVGLDSLKLKSSRRIVLTPVIEGSDGQRVRLRPIVVNGRNQQIMYERRDHRSYDALNAYTVRRLNGTSQTLEYSASAPYADWMRSATVKLDEDLCGCGETESAPSETLHTMYAPQCAYISPVAAKTKTYQMSGRAYIDFPVNRTELHPDYRNNARELKKIVDTINVVKADPLMSITNIDIHGYASPESPYKHNAYLAENRAATLKNYVRQIVQLGDRLFSVHYTAEDWDGLRRQIAASDIDSRDRILAIANDETLDPDSREAAIKKQFPEQYRQMLQDIYPALRHTDYVITCTVRPFTADEARELIKTKPQLLSQNEMYMVAETYEAGSAEFNEVMETAVRMFPDDTTANLNAACSRLAAEQWNAAKPYLDKAGTTAEADNARGVYYWNTGDEQQALTLFDSAARKGSKEAARNLENLKQ